MSFKSKLEKLPGYNAAMRPWHYLQALGATVRYNRPAKNLRVIAVTGTNGKTTTCFMIWKMLSDAGLKTGLLTTVAWGGVNGDEKDVVLAKKSNDKIPLKEVDAGPLHQQLEHMTTERVGLLNRRIKAIANSGAEFLVLEVTSHALMQSRILGIPTEIAVFTNLTHEHLDYHGTFAKYRAAKLKLFKRTDVGVVNHDDKNASYFEELYAPGDIITYGIQQGDYRATDIKLSAAGIEYSCGDMDIWTQIPGRFNVYNSLAAVAVGKKIGLTDGEVERGIAALTAVEGRMTRVRGGQDFEVIVDYAHAPDALEKVFESVGKKANAGNAGNSDGAKKLVKKLAKVKKTEKGKEESEDKVYKKIPQAIGQIISVHGGAGRRDPSTREERGEILGRESDIVIITEDDSRDEDPAEIAAVFVKGAEKAGKKVDKDLFVELDRRAAIRKALEMAKPGDLVLILGKGHEKTILRADGPHDFEDIEVATELLREMKENKSGEE